MRMPFLLLAFPLSVAAAPQMPMADAPTSCPVPAAPLPAGLAAWKQGPSLAAATDAKSLVSARLTIGRRSEAMLAPTDTVRFVLKPGKPGEPLSKGGMLGVKIARAGTYRVALGTGAWIDLVKRGKALTSVAHDHGPACSGVRKMVDFALKPGAYVLQIEGSKDATAPVLVTRLP